MKTTIDASTFTPQNSKKWTPPLDPHVIGDWQAEPIYQYAHAK